MQKPVPNQSVSLPALTSMNTAVVKDKLYIISILTQLLTGCKMFEAREGESLLSAAICHSLKQSDGYDRFLSIGKVPYATLHSLQQPSVGTLSHRVEARQLGRWRQAAYHALQIKHMSNCAWWHKSCRLSCICSLAIPQELQLKRYTDCC